MVPKVTESPAISHVGFQLCVFTTPSTNLWALDSYFLHVASVLVVQVEIKSCARDVNLVIPKRDDLPMEEAVPFLKLQFRSFHRETLEGSFWVILETVDRLNNLWKNECELTV